VVLCLLNVFNDVLVKPFMAHRSIIALDIGILLRLARVEYAEYLSDFFSAHASIYR